MSQSNIATNRRSANDESLESLRKSHQKLEQRLEQLDGQRSLSPEEEFEVQVLKKRKLALKDQILARRSDP